MLHFAAHLQQPPPQHLALLDFILFSSFSSENGNSWWGIALEKRQEAIRLELEELRKPSAIDSLELDVLKN